MRWLAARWALPVALLAGLAMPFAFAPFGVAPLAPLALGVVFAIVTAAPRRRALLAAYLFGLGYAGLGVYWIYISVSQYGGGPLAGALVTPFFIAVFALYPLAALWLGRALGKGRSTVTVLVALPLAWVAEEWLRRWLFTGATWLSVGYSQIDTPLAPLAPVFGTYSLSLVVAALAGSIAYVLLRPLSWRALAPIGLVVFVLGVSLVAEQSWTRPADETLDVVLVQGNVAQDRKWLPDNRERTIRYYAQATAAHSQADLAIWPETAVPAWYHEVRDGALRRIAQRAEARETAIVTGIPVIDPQRRAAFNAVTVLGEPGRFYYKRHLVPFGEYVPFREWFGGALDFLGAPMGDFGAGRQATLLEAAGHRLGVSVCYEVTFGDEIADALPGAEILVNVSNDAWFGDSLAPHQHLQMARMRALETGRDLLRATNTGVTAIIDHRGIVTARAPSFEQTVLEGRVQPRQGQTPYVRWEDWPVAGATLVGVLLLVAVPRRQAGTR